MGLQTKVCTCTLLMHTVYRYKTDRKTIPSFTDKVVKLLLISMGYRHL